jgi:DNA-binding protein HU-beta
MVRRGEAPVNKSSLVSDLVNRTGINRRDVSEVVEAFLSIVKKAVASGQRVSLSGFGTFHKQNRNPRLARNPRTGEVVKVPATVTPHFRAGKDFKELVAVPKKRKPSRKKPTRKTTRKR